MVLHKQHVGQRELVAGRRRVHAAQLACLWRSHAASNILRPAACACALLELQGQ